MRMSFGDKSIITTLATVMSVLSCPLFYRTPPGLELFEKPRGHAALRARPLILLTAIARGGVCPFLFDKSVRPALANLPRNVRVIEALNDETEQALVATALLNGLAGHRGGNKQFAETARRLERLWNLGKAAVVRSSSECNHDDYGATGVLDPFLDKCSVKPADCVGMSLGSGIPAYARARIDGTLGEGAADGIIFVDNGEHGEDVVSGGVTLSDDIRDFLVPGSDPRRSLVELHASRTESLGTGFKALYVQLYTSSCTPFFVYQGAFVNKLGSHAKCWARYLKKHGDGRFVAALARDVDAEGAASRLVDLKRAVDASPECQSLLFDVWDACLGVSDLRSVQSGACDPARRPANAIFETNRSGARLLEGCGRIKDWMRSVVVGPRAFFVHEDMLPTLDLLDRCAIRGKCAEGRGSRSKRSMIHSPELAARIEPAVYDAILVAAIMDLEAARIVGCWAIAELERRNKPKRGGRFSPDPVLEYYASASAKRFPRLMK